MLQELMNVVKGMLRDTEVAVRSFMMLRPRFLHPSTGTATSSTAATQTPNTALVPTSSAQTTPTSIVPVFDFYSGVPKRPSPFLQQTVTRFEKCLGECRQWIEELEQLTSNMDDSSLSSDNSLLHSLPKVMSNVHDFFVHIAAKVEGLHQYIESMKAAYLADQRRRGDGSDPFLEADRREMAKQEAAARRVHPTLHLPAVKQTSAHVAGLFATSAVPGTSNVPQPTAGSSAASSSSSFSFVNPQSSSAPVASTTSSFLFSTPTTAATSSSLFGSSGFTPQPTLFGSAASTPLFGSTQTPSAFGASNPSFTPTPAIGGSSIFSTPFASGAATGSGASFGGATKSAKPKARSSRR
ncbi:Nucleoporin p58/p45 [Asimina triloba]